MCGRFVGCRNIEQLKRYFPIDEIRTEVAPNYNVAPTQQIPVVFRQGAVNVLERFHWGLVPHWAKDVSIGSRMINARMETVATKPSFRVAFKKRRCLIPADGFYEWQKVNGKKQPVFITLPGDQPLAFAGLWETWGEEYLSCTIITRPASDCILGIHDRMPAVLQPDTYFHWLDSENCGANEAIKILTEKTVTDFAFWPVSRQVNLVKFNSPANIEPIQGGNGLKIMAKC